MNKPFFNRKTCTYLVGRRRRRRRRRQKVTKCFVYELLFERFS